ncbi:MAG: T9SS type A sorting domain-containing protein [Bacteroidales bacterium]|nr:T9SS type A sorting domain-containing protein [Bacteroidales bacterium]
MKKISTLLIVLLSTLFATAQNSDFVFSYDFTTTNELNEWTVIDNNNDGVNWEFMDGMKGIVYNGNTTEVAADDWLISPSFAVESGKYYIIEYTVAQRGSFGTDIINVHYGSRITTTSSTLLTEERYDHHAGMVTRKCHITVQEGDDVQLGFNITSAASNGLVTLKSVSVQESTNQRPAQAPAMLVSSDFNAKTVTVKWINPERDVNDIIINQPMTAKIYENDIVVATLENMTAGEQVEYVQSPENFVGMVTYGVTLSIDDLESEVIEHEINLDDYQGTMTTLIELPINNSSDFSTNWTVQNLDGGATWEYYAKGASIAKGSSTSANDWLFSPAVELEANKRYVLCYKLKSSMTYCTNIDMTVGTAATSSAHTQVVDSYVNLYQNGFAEYQSPQFTVEETGTYHLGFHVTYTENYFDMKDISVGYVEQAGGGDEEVGDLEVEEYVETVLPDNDNGDLTYTTEYFTPMTMEGVDFFGAFSHAQVDAYTLADNGVYAMPLETGFTPNLNSPLITAEVAGGVTYHDGKIYCNTYDDNTNTQEVKPVWKIYDANTYELIAEKELNDNCENTTICLSYDMTTDNIYGLVKDYTDTWLVQINPETGEMTRIADRLDYTKRFLTLGCNAKGELYCVYMTEDNVTGDQTHYLGRINKADGAIVEVGKIQETNFMNEDFLYNMKYRQVLFFDNSSDTMYWMFCSSSLALGSQYAAIVEVNRYNAVATLRAYQLDLYAIAGAYFNEPSMLAPSIITDFNFTDDADGANSGTITFKLPSTSYNGDNLSGTVNYRVYADELDEFTGSGAPGQEIAIPIQAYNDIITLNLLASNASGEGPTIQREILVGYDLPEAPKNIVLTKEGNGLETTLTWDAPEIGVNGGDFDVENLNYTVIRYPGEEVVVEGTTERVLVETHSGDMTRYVYEVYSCIGDVRSEGAFSNNLIVGDPLNTPYGGVFGSVYDMYNYYTIVDANNDGYPWLYDEMTGAAVYHYNWAEAANDWMISPAINFRSDAVYTLSFGAFSSQENYLESLLVTFGDGYTPESQNEVLIDIPELPAIDDDGNYDVYNIEITVPVDGVYHYGFKAYSKPYQDYLYLYDIKLTSDKDDEGINDIATDESKVLAFSDNSMLKVFNPENENISIYNVLGILLHKSNDNYIETNLTSGLYIVKYNNGCKKVIVK